MSFLFHNQFKIVCDLSFQKIDLVPSLRTMHTGVPSVTTPPICYDLVTTVTQHVTVAVRRFTPQGPETRTVQVCRGR